MVGIASFSSSEGGASASSGMEFLRARGCHVLGRVSGLSGPGLGAVAAGGRDGFFVGSREGGWRLRRCILSLQHMRTAAGGSLDLRIARQDGGLLFDLELRNLLLDLRLEFVGGAAKFIHELAHLAGDLRQLLGPEDDQGQEEQEDRFRKTHGSHHTVPRGDGQTRAIGACTEKELSAGDSTSAAACRYPSSGVTRACRRTGTGFRLPS